MHLRTQQLFHALVIVASVHAVGCMADEPTKSTSDDDTATATSALTGTNQPGFTFVPTGVECSDESWTVQFWSDASETVLVGEMTCTCWQPELLGGAESNYDSLLRERQCSTQ